MGSVELKLQDPVAPDGYLLEALLDACEGAHEGGAVFAFATGDGVRLLLGGEDFHRFLLRAERFELVVGVDAITNAAALDAIGAVGVESLRARAFLNDRRPLLFHPKFAWFRSPDHMTLIMGSGNLTRGGLRSNWEAFNVVAVDEPEAASLDRQIKRWLDHWETLLRPLDDPSVRERAARNTGRERDLQVPASEDIGRELEVQEITTFEPGEPVLIAELSRSRGAEQANFHLEHYEGYFGARKGARHHIILRRVLPNGNLAEDEPRGNVPVASQNYRFELTGLKGHEYPQGDLTPIAVFVKTAGAIFIYKILWPDDPGHEELSVLLDEKAGERVGRSRMRQVRATPDELSAAWPANPLLRAIPSA